MTATFAGYGPILGPSFTCVTSLGISHSCLEMLAKALRIMSEMLDQSNIDRWCQHVVADL